MSIPSTSVVPIQYAGMRALELANAHGRLVVIPELGGKIVSLTAGGRQALWQDPTRPYRAIAYGDDFGSSDASGFDECFPTIGECSYPEPPWQGIVMVDHGELWCTPWHAQIVDHRSVYLHAYGVRLPYHFEKWIAIDAEAARWTLRYRVTNPAPFPFQALWSAHPLFAAAHGMRVLLPGAPAMRLSHAIGERVAPELDVERRWPWLPGLDGERVDYSVVGSPELRANDKVFVDTPPEGWCALWHPGDGTYAGFTLSAETTPFIGVCINHGGYPFSGQPAFWVALEPCSGRPDRLDEACRRGTAVTVGAGQSREWTLGLQLGVAAVADDVGRALARPFATPSPSGGSNG